MALSVCHVPQMKNDYPEILVLMFYEVLFLHYVTYMYRAELYMAEN